MEIAISILGGILLGFIIYQLIIYFFAIPRIFIYRVDYTLYLNLDEQHTITGFSKYYWNESAKNKDIKKNEEMCKNIRNKQITDENRHLVELINAKYNIDFECLYIKHDDDYIKPSYK